MKSTREQLNVLDALREGGSFRSAASLCGECRSTGAWMGTATEAATFPRP